MLIYLADLCHNHVKGLNSVPLNIGYLASYAHKQFGDSIQIKLFKHTEELLNSIDENPPALIGLTNYTWNQSLNKFVAEYIKATQPNTVLCMGGPNIRLDEENIYNFLKKNHFIDKYIMLEGEIAFSNLIKEMLEQNKNINIVEFIKSKEIEGCFSISDNKLIGKKAELIKDLDDIPSPYLTGVLDKFLNPDFIPLFESNRGCPYTCTYCAWGISSQKKLRKFSLDRICEEMNYVANKDFYVPYWTFADANFGVLVRDLEIAKQIRKIYENKKPFASVEIWWDKSAQDHMIEISKTLGNLSNAYIAFQTFDTNVLNLIKRKNINLERLKYISKKLSVYSDRLHTDILLGLPGETYSSHLKSLETALNMGFESIGGGEIRLLPGSELEMESSRKEFALKTKYRLTQEGYGIYRNKFIYELEESVRATSHISEDEMLKLRVLRAIFYGSISIGQYLPLIKYLIMKEVDILELFDKIVQQRHTSNEKLNSIEWLIESASNEWFDSIEDAEEFFTDKTNQNNVLNQSAIKLNYDFLSYLLQSSQEYNAFNRYMQEVILNYYPQCDKDIILDIFNLCETRNYLLKCINGNYQTTEEIKLLSKTIDVLADLNIIKKEKENINTLTLKMDETIGGNIKSKIVKENITIQSLSWILQSYNIFMKIGAL